MRADVDRRLDELSPHSACALDAAIRYALLAPGKRLRPLLTMLAARELGVPALRALDAACALEMIHAASLVLDDLPCMDDAPSRRGQPSAHRVFGQDVAVLAAVTLLSRAYAALANAPGLAPEQRVRLVAVATEAVGSNGLAGGQLRDLRGAHAALDSVSDGNHRKTGALFVAAALMAGAVAGSSEAQVKGLCTFATHLGQAFQIMDDLQDGPDVCGEGGSATEDAGKITVLSLLGRDGARRRLESHLRHAGAALRPGSDLAMFARQIFDQALGSSAASLARVAHA